MLALVVTVPAGEAELASDALWALGVAAIEERTAPDDAAGTEDHFVELTFRHQLSNVGRIELHDARRREENARPQVRRPGCFAIWRHTPSRETVLSGATVRVSS